MVENRSLTLQQQGRSFPEDLEGMKQESTSRNTLKPPGHTGQREDLFTNHLELLLANLFGFFFFLCFQSYFIFVYFLVKPNLKSWEVLDVLTFKEDGAVSSKL